MRHKWEDLERQASDSGYRWIRQCQRCGLKLGYYLRPAHTDVTRTVYATVWKQGTSITETAKTPPCEPQVTT